MRDIGTNMVSLLEVNIHKFLTHSSPSCLKPICLGHSSDIVTNSKKKSDKQKSKEVPQTQTERVGGGVSLRLSCSQKRRYVIEARKVQQFGL